MQLKILLRLLCPWGKRTSKGSAHWMKSKRIGDEAATTTRQFILNEVNTRRHFLVTSDVVVHRLDLRSFSLIRDILVSLRIGSSFGYRYFFLAFPYKSFIRHLWPLPVGFSNCIYGRLSSQNSSSRTNLNNLISLTRFAGAVYCTESVLGLGLNPE